MEIRTGYKQTDAGVIPEAWECGRASNLIQRMKSGLSRRLEEKDIGIPVLISSNIQNTRLVTESLKFWYINDPQGANVSDYILNDGDILICFINSLAQIGKPCIFRDIGRPVIYTTNIFRIVTLERVSTEFVLYLFSSISFQECIQNIAKVAVNQASFTKPDFLNIPVPIPPVNEQRAIAEALSDADALIEFLDQLIAKKRQIKQGATQELLTCKRRLPGFSGEWEVKRLGDFGSTYGGLTGKTKADFGEGSSRYITFMNVMANIVIDCDIFELVNVSSTESQNRAAKGDLFFNGSSETPEEVGLCSVLANSVADVYLNSFCFGFRFRDGAKANGLYFAYFFRSLEGRELLKSLAQGATRYNLSKTALLKVAFPLPSLEEQTAIATVLSDMDTELAALESRLAKARQIKQGMMQELLTGRIRLL